MTSVYDDIKSVALRQLPIVRDLFGAYLRLDGSRFLLQSETPLATRLATTLCLIVAYVALLVAFTFLNPTAQSFTVYTAARSATQGTLIFLVTCVPIYLVVRPGTGIRSFNFFLNLQLTATIVAVVVMYTVTVVGLLLSPNLQRDASEIGAGRGHASALYQEICGKLEFRRDTLRMQVELNALTGEYDQPLMRGSIFRSEQEEREVSRQFAIYMFRQVERERALPPPQRERINQLRSAIPPRMLQQLPAPSRIVSEYPYFFYLFFGVQLVVPITSFLSYIMIWKVFVRSVRTRKRRWVMGARVVLGVAVSISFTFWVFLMMTNRTLHVTYDLDETRQMLREDAEHYAWCRLDPKGLW